jgi:hypothetical protein
MAFDGENLQAGTLIRQPQGNARIVWPRVACLRVAKERRITPPRSSTIAVPLRPSVRRWYSEVSATRPQLY